VKSLSSQFSGSRRAARGRSYPRLAARGKKLQASVAIAQANLAIAQTSLTMATIIPMATKSTIATCIQIQLAGILQPAYSAGAADIV
jgi:hypothetical protein